MQPNEFAQSKKNQNQNKLEPKTKSTMQVNDEATSHSDVADANKMNNKKTEAPTSTATTITVLQHRWHPQHHLVLIVSLSMLVLLLATLHHTNAFDVGEQYLREAKYTDFYKNISYRSNTNHNDRGMGWLYKIAHKLLWFFTGPTPIPKGYIVFEDMQFHFGPKVERNDWGDLLKQYWGVMLVAVLVVLLAVIVPLVGLCCCCCIYAGACTGEPNPCDEKFDSCRRCFLGFLLIVLTTGLLLGVIAAFVCNGFMQVAVDDSTQAVRDGSADTLKFLEVTTEHVDHKFISNFKELSDQLEINLKKASDYIINKLEEKSKVVSLIYLTDFIDKLPVIRETLKQMRTITNQMQAKASELYDDLRTFERELFPELEKCWFESCREAKTLYLNMGEMAYYGIEAHLETDRYFLKIPDVSNIIASLDTLILNNIGEVGLRGKHAIKTMRDHLQEAVDELTPQILAAIKLAGEDLKKSADEFRVEMKKISDIIKKNTDKYSSVTENFLMEYSKYRFYLGLGACIALLSVLLLSVLALCCGVCGRRPSCDGYNDDCCNKGTGGTLLGFAAFIMFLSFSAIILIAFLHLLLGIVAHRGVCMPLRDPENDEVFAVFNNAWDLNQVIIPSMKIKKTLGVLPPLRISQIVHGCHQNQTLYEVLHGQNIFDIREFYDYPHQKRINQTLDSLVEELDFRDEDLELFSAEDKQRILLLYKSALSDFNSGSFVDTVKNKITENDIMNIHNAIITASDNAYVWGGVASNTEDRTAEWRRIQNKLRNLAMHFKGFYYDMYEPLLRESKQLSNLAESLASQLQYMGRPFGANILAIIEEIDYAQKFLKVEARPFIKESANELRDYFAKEIHRYLDRIVYAVEHKIGACAPLAMVYDAGVVALCNRVVDPLNGYWVATFFSAVFFLPMICVGLKLSRLYRKTGPYQGPICETEYLYDAYSEHDHIPLANGPKNKRRKNKDRRRRDYYEESMVSAGPPAIQHVSGVRDTRYNDMAPKHWDGGPPRYQNPPMAPPASEYERPPPYYYPGATEQD